MEIEKKDAGRERLIITGLIMDDHVLGTMVDKWESDLFESKYLNLIFKWCVNYYERFEKAPKENIQNIFESWASKNPENPIVDLVEDLLEDLSDEFENDVKINAEYTIDAAGNYFNETKLRAVAKSILGDLNRGELNAANERLDDFCLMEIGTKKYVDVLNDMDAVKSAFEDDADGLIKYTGDLGRFLNRALTHDSFISFLAPEKRGKSWFLQDIAWKAMIQRRKVAFFSVGDMSEKQMLRRMYIRAAGHPIKPKRDFPLTTQIPKNITSDPDNDYQIDVDYEERTFESPLDWRKAYKSCEHLLRRMRTKKSYLRLSTHPNDSLSVHGIESILKTWERSDNWIPDFVVIDYADILADPTGTKDTRDAINKTWKRLRRLSQTRHCCVVTATQADARSYGDDLMSMQNFSEDKRKFSHVTGMIGINQNTDEKSAGIYRLNWIVTRNDHFTPSQCVHVVGNLDMGRPMMLSTF